MKTPSLHGRIESLEANASARRNPLPVKGLGSCPNCANHPYANPDTTPPDHTVKCVECGRMVYLATFYTPDRPEAPCKS